MSIPTPSNTTSLMDELEELEEFGSVNEYCPTQTLEEMSMGDLNENFGDFFDFIVSNTSREGESIPEQCMNTDKEVDKVVQSEPQESRQIQITFQDPLSLPEVLELDKGDEYSPQGFNNSSTISKYTQKELDERKYVKKIRNNIDLLKRRAAASCGKKKKYLGFGEKRSDRRTQKVKYQRGEKN